MKRLLLIFALIASPVFAVQPDEILDDPALEARAREISAGLRCPICRNESIDESNAGLSRELRLVVRERLVAGDSNDDVLAYMVARYGEFILLNPTKEGANIILWLAAPAMLLAALGIGWVAIRQRKVDGSAPLSETEQAELDKILNT